MSILSTLAGWCGISNAFAETTNTSIDRANVRFLLPADSRLYLSAFSRERINEKAEWLWQNFGIVKEMVAGIARHAVGKGITAQFNTKNLEWNAAVEADVEKWALTPDRCDLAGRRNLYESQLTAVEQYIIRGEFIAAHVQNPRWKAAKADQVDAPAFFILDTNDVRTPPGTDTTKVRMIDGVELGVHSEATGYHVRTFEKTFTRYDAANVCHWYKGHAVHQIRGVSHFAQAVNSLVDIHELKRLTTRTAKAQQLLAIVLKDVTKKKGRGAMGALQRAGTGNGEEGSTENDTAELEKLYGAAGAGIAYVGKDGDAKLLSSGAPSPLVEPFISDLLMRDASLAPGVPPEFFWNPSKLGGANTRFILSRADLLFQHLADALIYRWIEPLVVRYVRWRIANGFIPVPPEPNWADTISWQLPARVTVDNGRDGRLEIEQVNHGMDNLRGCYDRRGKSWRPETRQWIREWREFKLMCLAEGLSDEEAEKLMVRWRPMPPGSAPANEQEAETSGGKKGKEDDTEEAA